MDKKKLLFIILGGAVIIAVIVAAAVRGSKGTAVDVKTAVATERVYEDKVLATGQVQVIHPAAIYAPFGAQLTSLKVQEGDQVAAGQSLGELDTTDLQSKVKEAKSALDLAQAQLEQAKSAPNPTGQPVSTKVQQVQEEQARAAYNSAVAAVEKGHLTAPAGGTVLKVAVKEGDYLQPGMLVLEIGSLDQVQVVAGLNEQDVSGVSEGLAAEFQWAGTPGVTYHGQVTRVSPSVTKSELRQTDNVVKVFLSVADSGGRLKPGATVDTMIYRVRPKRSVQIPNEALTGRGNKRSVFVVVGDTLRKKEVQIGHSNELYTEILSGLKNGERVVVSPSDKLKVGERVNPGGGR